MSVDAKSKIKDVSLTDFVAYVREKEKNLCEKAEKDKVLVDSIIERIKSQTSPEFSVLTAGVKARATIREEIRLASAIDMECYYLGMLDRPAVPGATGSLPPASVALLRFSADGKKAMLFEASTFDPLLEKPDGTKVQLAGMGKVKLKLTENAKFEGKYDIAQLLSYEPLPAEQMAKIIVKAVNNPQKFSNEDKYMPIIVLGTIKGIFTENVLMLDEATKKWKASGESYPVLVLNQLKENPVKTPVIKIDMEPIHGIKVKANLSPRRFTAPIVEVLDLPECIHAAVRDIRDPKEQAEAVSKEMTNRDILVVGSISRVSASKNDITYMDISVYSILDFSSNEDLSSFGAGNEENAASAEKGKGKSKAAKAAPPATTQEPPATAPAAEGPKIEKFKDVLVAIRECCIKLNMKPSQLTVESAKDLACPDAKNGIIEAALDELKEELK